MKVEDIRKQAQKAVEAKKTLYVVAVVFSFVTLILLALSIQMPSVSFWLLLPIPAFLMVLGIIYLSAYGFPIVNKPSEDWEREAIEKEMIRIYLRKKEELPASLELNDLRELEVEALDNLNRGKEGGYL